MSSRLPPNFPWLSSRAQRGICLWGILVGLFLVPPNSAQNPPKRPRILGIAEVRFFSTNIGAARDFYSMILGTKEISPNAFSLNSQQSLALFAAPSPIPSNLLAEVVFETDDLRELVEYLSSLKIKVTTNLVTVQRWDVIGLPGYSTFFVTDPEGHRISFIQYKSPLKSHTNEGQTSSHVIHAGFVVRDRAAQDHFYKDILGFHVYWHGGMKDDKDDWVDMQVPDGTDWIEYMLNLPPDADHHALGVMNHIALGVPDIHVAQNQLLASGMKLTEEPHIGRGGKWQLNLYDPDDTRIELMEFTPVQKPCCSEYTGPHPKP
jgi:catechol 2,3-dioxygenase-like lactoylglutathione lyase family enzyme